MSTERIGLDRLLETAVASLQNVAASALSKEVSAVERRPARLPRDMPGAYVPLLAKGDNLQVGIASSLDGCCSIARSLLMMGPDEDLSASDVADAVGEFINILAGELKTRIAKDLSPITLGLPLFLNGAIEPTEALDFAIADLRIGETAASLLIVHQK
ncbi:MAG TPA: chemotaxis protein CheX [Vulgatibacter sp.]|nr:chemotaxis protein CheX [Vulgatibacter sp.]